ncbi:RNA polymerase sigma-70 factor [Chitinophaga tropicalis]|uniref:RNA polymerase sigma-70 factor n=1 Tax=Chitinophaga tropicalis TaxID=2683588 RepID=A0A7K1U3N3_9BACT|nr:RNA polymerase sigma-70 factor [Chitinophaga tropicalis]MVT08961.1 RNA polymerase sigma-70 factor [Chitinophaga tropicalis]
MSGSWKSPEEFEALFRKHYRYLCIVALRITKNEEDARDIVQYAFSDIWLKRDTLNIIGDIGAYLYRIVKNKSLDMVNTRKIIPVELTPSIEDTTADEVYDEVIHNQRIAALWERIDTLPAMCRKIFVMCKIEGRKYQEIADQLGISVKTVGNHMGKAWKAVREGYW